MYGEKFHKWQIVKQDHPFRDLTYWGILTEHGQAFNSAISRVTYKGFS